MCPCTVPSQVGEGYPTSPLRQPNRQSYNDWSPGYPSSRAVHLAGACLLRQMWLATLTRIGAKAFHACGTGWDPRRVARRMGFAFFGVLNGTEVNPQFFDDILKQVDNEVGAVLLCNLGGTLEPTKGNGSGTQSR